VVRGSVSGPDDLPWLDVEQAFNIAVNRRLGDDVAIALDHRTDPSDPRVVGSDAWTSQHQTGQAQYAWREVAPLSAVRGSAGPGSPRTMTRPGRSSNGGQNPDIPGTKH
jgi:hypothetical protein